MKSIKTIPCKDCILFVMCRPKANVSRNYENLNLSSNFNILILYAECSLFREWWDDMYNNVTYNDLCDFFDPENTHKKGPYYD